MSSLFELEITQLEAALNELAERLTATGQDLAPDELAQHTRVLAELVAQATSRLAKPGVIPNPTARSRLAAFGERLQVVCALANDLELVQRQRLNVLQASASKTSDSVYGAQGLLGRPMTSRAGVLKV